VADEAAKETCSGPDVLPALPPKELTITKNQEDTAKGRKDL